MKYIDKTGTPVPEILKSKGEKETLKNIAEYKKSKAKYISNTPGTKTTKDYTVADSIEIDKDIYGHKEVKSALINLQKKCCCFCESRITHISSGDVEHFRPKNGYSQDQTDLFHKPGYFWLAYDWSNLFFSCEQCNRRFKKKYTHRDCNDANVRGAIDIPQHIKRNIPFSGNIAYKVKEYAYDNDLTQLIRHTIEYIRSSNMAYVLKTDADTEAYVSQICSITPSYRRNVLNSVIAKNLKSICHPYYTEYRMLQKLCINILHHKRLKYGIDDNRIYGLLFSGSWLWEEFLYKTVLSDCGFFHPQNRSGKGGIHLFDKSNVDIDFVMSRCKRYPDYFKENCILDAKYKHLDNNRIDRNDMHQIISYMHVEKADIGGFIFPTSQEDVTITKLGNLRGYGGWIYNIGVPIPKEEGTFAMFVAAMTNVLQELKDKILTLC